MKFTLVGAPFPPKRGGRQRFDREVNFTTSWELQQVSLERAGAGAAAGAGGAGASAGFTSSLAAGFGASLALHPIPIEAILITKTSARKRKIHFFMLLHLLSE